MTALLEARNVGKTFGGGLFSQKQKVALQSASLTISDDRPSITAIAGESGSGKTTLARILLGITQPSSGQILYKGQELSKLDGNQWKTFRREVQAVFQDPFEVYNPFYNVDHVLTMPIGKFYPHASQAETRKMMEDALRAVGLRPEETLGRYPHQLSGGQRQRIMVARALLLKPRIIVADEPVSMVDASLRATILESLLNVHKQFNISLIYITHDLTTAYQLSENIMMMYQGAVVETGDVDLVIASASASCGCTVPKYDKKPVPPSGSGTIEVVFDTSGREGVQAKTVVVLSNAENNIVILRIIADVTKND